MAILKQDYSPKLETEPWDLALWQAKQSFKIAELGRIAGATDFPFTTEDNSNAAEMQNFPNMRLSSDMRSLAV